MKKRVLGLMLTVSMVFSLAGCGTNKGTAEAGEKNLNQVSLLRW